MKKETQKKKIDPITLEVIRNALYSVSDEMSAALIRTAYSTNIKDRRDCSCAVYLITGEVVAQSEIGTPLHLGVMPAVVDTVLKRFPPDKMDPGDDIIMNETYPAGPGHLNDVTLVSPIFYKGKAVALVANQAHHVDVGGYAPGSMPFGVTETFQEGLQIPPVKIVKRDVIDEEIASLISDNVRTKTEFRGDLLAQVASNNVGERRFLELIYKYGQETVMFYLREIMNYSERRMREGIRRIPDGTYSFEDFIEGDSITEDLIKIKVKVEVRGDEVLADFTGSSPQVQGPAQLQKGLNCCLRVLRSQVHCGPWNPSKQRSLPTHPGHCSRGLNPRFSISSLHCSFQHHHDPTNSGCPSGSVPRSRSTESHGSPSRDSESP